MNEHIENIIKFADIICSDYKSLDRVSLYKASELQELLDKMQEELDYYTTELLEELN